MDVPLISALAGLCTLWIMVLRQNTWLSALGFRQSRAQHGEGFAHPARSARSYIDVQIIVRHEGSIGIEAPQPSLTGII